MNTAIQKGPGLFFFVYGRWLFHGCHLNDAESYGGEKIILGYDEHYQCHMCNDCYVI